MRYEMPQCRAEQNEPGTHRLPIDTQQRVQSRDRAGIREPHKRLKEDDSRWLPGKGNFAVTKTIFIKIHLSTIAGVWWLELLFINFIKVSAVLNKIKYEMVLVLNICPH